MVLLARVSGTLETHYTAPSAKCSIAFKEINSNESSCRNSAVLHVHLGVNVGYWQSWLVVVPLARCSLSVLQGWQVLVVLGFAELADEFGLHAGPRRIERGAVVRNGRAGELWQESRWRDAQRPREPEGAEQLGVRRVSLD